MTMGAPEQSNLWVKVTSSACLYLSSYLKAARFGPNTHSQQFNNRNKDHPNQQARGHYLGHKFWSVKESFSRSLPPHTFLMS